MRRPHGPECAWFTSLVEHADDGMHCGAMELELSGRCGRPIACGKVCMVYADNVIVVTSASIAQLATA